jgi:hypothetical protein
VTSDVAEDRAAAHVDHRTLRLDQQLQGFLDLPAVPFVTGLYERIEILSGYGSARGVSDVLRDVHHDGPGRPVVAMWNAFLIVTASWFTSRTRKLCFTAGRVMPTVSHSWKAS